LLVAEMAGGDDTLVGSVILEQIAADDSCSHTFAINPRKVFAVYAACDGDCSDIDLLGEEVCRSLSSCRALQAIS
jgi:hypothetical protein